MIITSDSMTFQRAVAAADLADGQGIAVTLNDILILICRSDGELFAVRNMCTHARSRLDGGRIRNGVITCPLHGARFELASGRCVSRALNYDPLTTYPVRELDGYIEVDLS